MVRSAFQELEDDERPSMRRLDSVGAVAVLEAMVEQRVRRSSVPPPPPSLELCTDDDEGANV